MQQQQATTFFVVDIGTGWRAFGLVLSSVWPKIRSSALGWQSEERDVRVNDVNEDAIVSSQRICESCYEAREEGTCLHRRL